MQVVSTVNEPSKHFHRTVRSHFVLLERCLVSLLSCAPVVVASDQSGGNCCTSFIANIRIESDFLGETIRTCRFAQRMLNVTNRPTLNVVQSHQNDAYVKGILDENKHLKEELAMYDAMAATNRPPNR